MLLLGWLIEVFRLEFLNVETSINVGDEDNPTSEPMPDLIVLNQPTWEIKGRNPNPDEIRLAAEISDSTLGFDLTRKASLYARAGIKEYWVLDVPKRRMIVHREPVGGVYKAVTAYGDHEAVSAITAPDASFSVGAAFREA